MSIPIGRYYDLLRAFEEYEKQNPPTKTESEDNIMLHKVTITKSEEKVLEEYWLMRAIKENPETKAKTVVKESECAKEPTLEEIALFLANSGGNFVSVEHNYRFADLPF